MNALLLVVLVVVVAVAVAVVCARGWRVASALRTRCLAASPLAGTLDTAPATHTRSDSYYFTHSFHCMPYSY